MVDIVSLDRDATSALNEPLIAGTEDALPLTASDMNPAPKADGGQTQGVMDRAAEAAKKGFAAPSPVAAGAAQATVDGVRAGAAAVAEGARTVTGAVNDPAKTAEEVKQGAKTFWEKLDIGSLLGGGLGVLIAFLCGNFFGEGAMGTLMTIGLAIPLMIMGSSQFGGWINEKLGRAPAKDPGAEQAHGKSANVQAVAQVVTPTAETPMTTLTPEAMTAMLDAAKRSGAPAEALVWRTNADKKVTPEVVNLAEASPEDKAKLALPGMQHPVEVIRDAMAECKRHGYQEAVAVLGVPKGMRAGCATTDGKFVSSR